MPVVYAIAMKLLWWALPKLIERVSDYFEAGLRAIEEGTERIASGSYADGATARHIALQRLLDQEGSLPESWYRFTIEICLVLHRMGITAERLDAMEGLVTDKALHGLTGKEKRDFILQRVQAFFSDVSETTARLLVEWAVVKVKAGIGGSNAT